MARGDHIRVDRGLYWHHGVDVGDGFVIHAPAEPLRLGEDPIRRDTLAEFVGDGTVEVVHHPDSLTEPEIVARAESRLGERGYDVFFNNCEHFARWCVTGKRKSDQVEAFAAQTVCLALTARAGLGWLARRGGSRLAARALPVLGPILNTATIAGLALSALSRLQEGDNRD